MTTNCPTAKFAEPLAPLHPKGMTRRRLVQVGAVGLLGLGVEHLPSLQAGADDWIRGPISTKRRVIFLFLSGGLAQHESFDPKPNATDLIRGEFGSIPTRFGGGVRICEHLPKLAECSHLWSMVRSLTHGTNDHSLGHHVMLTGRSSMPAGFSPNQPSPTDEPSIASVAGAVTMQETTCRPPLFYLKNWFITPAESFPDSSPAAWVKGTTLGFLSYLPMIPIVMDLIQPLDLIIRTGRRLRPNAPSNHFPSAFPPI